MFRLIELPYRKDGLEPVIINKLLEGSEFEGMSLEDIVRKSPAGAIFNNAGQILNHELYFMQFKPVSVASQAPTGALATQIEKQWGTLDAFKSEFETKGVGLFGSGWVWLSADGNGQLVITQEPGASNPDYQNRRAAHLSALWQIIDWKIIEERYVGTKLH